MSPRDTFDQFDERSPEDVRFQYEIIKSLADSVRLQTAAIVDLQKGQTEILLRLERIEANRVSSRVEALEKIVDGLTADKNKRDGASGVWAMILKSPWVGGVIAAAAVLVAVFRKEL